MNLFGIYLLVFGLFSSKNGVEASRSKKYLELAFIVARPDTEQVTCVSEGRYGKPILYPSYDLDKLQIPSGGLTRRWTDDLKMNNIEVWPHRYFFRNNVNYFFIDGESKFHQYTSYLNGINILASNASLWFPPNHLDQDERKSLLVQIDHLNKSTGLKYTRVMSCNEIPKDKKEEDENCKTLTITQGTNFLNDGRNWASFFIKAIEIEKKNKETSSKSTWILAMYADYSWILYVMLTWMWPTPKTEQDVDLFVRTHQKPGVFFDYRGWAIQPKQADNQMSKSFSHQRAGNFCIVIDKSDYKPLRFHYDLLNLGNNQVGRQVFFNSSETLSTIKIEFGHLEAGNYQLTLRNLSSGLDHVEQCRGTRILKRPIPTFPATNHCHFIDDHITQRSLSLYSQGYTNSTLKTQWNADDWAYVCDQLGVSNNQTERVPIKFCNPLYGCNFSKCPHNNRDDQKPLFHSKKNSAVDSENVCFGEEI